MSGSRFATAKRGAFRAFGFLPRPLRRVLIRTIRPSWTAGAVGIVERPDGRWLFVKPVYRQGWTLPGGLVDRGEHPAATVVRELREELGLAVSVEGIAWVVMDPTYNRLETVFRVSVDPDADLEAVRVTTPELSDLGWFDPDAPPPVLEEETADVLALARQVADGGPTVLIRPRRA
jgi:8-oxo-dGTP diphosphatase